jgi:hypothetical protein
MWHTLWKNLVRSEVWQDGCPTDLHVRQFLELIQQTIHGKLARQVLEPPTSKTFRRAFHHSSENEV